jgi:hypothetical protein
MMDNWGVCNGLCQGATPTAEDMCMVNNFDDLGMPAPFGYNTVNECHDLAERTYRSTPRHEPWTAFLGEIKVCPQNCQ